MAGPNKAKWGILENIIKNVTLARLLKLDHLASTP